MRNHGGAVEILKIWIISNSKLSSELTFQNFYQVTYLSHIYGVVAPILDRAGTPMQRHAHTHPNTHSHAHERTHVHTRTHAYTRVRAQAPAHLRQTRTFTVNPHIYGVIAPTLDRAGIVYTDHTHTHTHTYTQTHANARTHTHAQTRNEISK